MFIRALETWSSQGMQHVIITRSDVSVENSLSAGAGQGKAVVAEVVSLKYILIGPSVLILAFNF